MPIDLEKERQEAIKAGHRALSSLHAAENYLSSASGWGFFDMMGGGLFTSLIKNSKMDDASREIERAKYDLQSFSKELDDVNTRNDLRINTTDLLTFADVFFDGFVADFLVQNRIIEAQDQVREAIRRVEDALSQLEK